MAYSDAKSLPGEPAQGVDVVAVDLGERTVALADIVHPRLRDTRPAGVGAHHHHVADGALVHQLFRLHEGGVKPPHERELQLDAVFLGGAVHLVAFLDGHRHRLFAQDVLARFGGSHRDLAVVHACDCP